MFTPINKLIPQSHLYETVHYTDKTILSYHLKGIAFDYSLFSFHEKINK